MSSPRSVVVTGASTGIGRATALYLAARGFRVFGAVRKESDGESLEAEGVASVLLDVTDESSIRAARERTAASLAGEGLDGLVNNAGIAVSGPLEFLPLEDLRHQFEVNLFGQIAVTQAFLPPLRRARGRVVNMSSISGRIAAPLLGPYTMSKFALESFSDALRRELQPFGMHVAVVEPGAIRTPIWDKSLDASKERLRNLPRPALELYGDLIEFLQKSAVQMRDGGAPPQEVASAVHHALTARTPKTRYLVGRDARIAAKLAWLLPDRALDALMRRRVR